MRVARAVKRVADPLLPRGAAPRTIPFGQGWEVLALQGSERLLSEHRPHLVVETHTEEHERACAELLLRHGYAPHVVEPRRRLPEVREGHNRWLIAEGRPAA